MSRRLHRRVLLVVIALFALTAFTVQAASTTISTEANWGRSYIESFGYPNTSTFGQTITAPAGVTSLDSFSFWMQLPTALQFRGYVLAWDAGQNRATGPSLFTSSLTSTSDPAVFQKITFVTGGLDVTPGVQYVIFVSIAEEYEANAGNGAGRLSFVVDDAGDAFAGDTAKYQSSGGNEAAWTINGWEYVAGDLAFEAVFTVQGASTTISTEAGSRSYVESFGYPLTSTFGQIITAPAGVTSLDSFSFWMQLPTALQFRGYVLAWDAGQNRATGPSLFTSSLTSTSDPTVYQKITFVTGGVDVTPGVQYIIFVSIAEEYETNEGDGARRLGFAFDNAYTGGSAKSQNGGDETTWTIGGWDAREGDLVFEVVFDISLDPTAPVITAAATTPTYSPYTGQWTNEDVTVTFTCADTGAEQSGIATDTLVSPVVVSTEGANQSVTSSGACTDNADNSATAVTFSPINIDKTAPEIIDVPESITITTLNPAGAVVTYDNATAVDALSGVNGPIVCTLASGSLVPLGENTVTCEAIDFAGNEGSATFTITVVLDSTVERDMVQACLFAGSLSQTTPLPHGTQPAGNCGRGELIVLYQGPDFHGCVFSGSLSQVGTSTPSSCGRGTPVGFATGTDLHGCAFAGSLTRIGSSTAPCSRGMLVGFARADS